MTEIRRGHRTATITVVHEVQIIQTALAAELTSLNNAVYQQCFPSAKVYVRDLPQNGKPIDFISRRDYNRGEGFLINVVFDVRLSYVASHAHQNFGEHISSLQMASSGTGFTSSKTFANATTYDFFANMISINPTFSGFMINGGAAMSESYEELIAHEAGFHNMMGQIHQMDVLGNAIYPSSLTLESRSVSSPNLRSFESY